MRAVKARIAEERRSSKTLQSLEGDYYGKYLAELHKLESKSAQLLSNLYQDKSNS